jgi:Signal transduction histidine kinase
MLFGLCVGLAGALFAATPPGLSFEERVGLAWLFHLRGPVSPPQEAAIVAIDERAAIDLGVPKAPREWPRSLHAQLLDALVERGADLVVFDLAFTRPQSDEADAAFADAIARADRVLLFETIERRLGSFGPGPGRDVIVETFGAPLPVFRDSALGIAPLPLPNVPTRISRFWTFLGDADDRVTLPALALTAYALHRDAMWPRLSPGWIDDPLRPAGGAGLKHRGPLRIDRMAQALRRQVKANVPFDNLPPPADDQARRARDALLALYAAPDAHYLNFYGPPGTIHHVNYARLLACQGRRDPPCDIDLDGTVVFVGLSELDKPPDFERDAFPTVFSRDDGVYLSGVEIAATAFANLLTTSTLEPLPLLFAFPLVLLVGCAFGLAAALLPPQAAAPTALAIGLTYTIAAQLAFAHPGVWLPLATPILGQLPLALLGGIGGQLLFARRQEWELRRAKAAVEAVSAAKTEVLREAGHDIRTPVQAMVSYLEQLRATQLDTGQRALLGRVLAASDDLLGVLNVVLDLAAIDAGKLRIVDEVVDLRRFSGGVIDMFRAEASAKGLALTLAIAEDVPQLVHTDPLRLRQILGNLLANAVKFTDRGHVTLRIRLADGVAGAAAIGFCVSDSGIGIGAEALAELFQPFSRGSGDATKRPGSGLGLSIARRLAELMDGSIDVESEPGVGSTFRLLLPLHIPLSSEMASAPVAPPAMPVWGAADIPPAAAPSPPPGRSKVLLVEDDPAISALLVRQLEELGLAVRAAADGLAGWECLQVADVDVLVTDYRLPKLDGPGLIRRVRADDRFAGLRIIGLSADTAAEVETTFVAAGADAVLAKPVTHRRLAQALRRLGAAVADQADAEPLTPAMRPTLDLDVVSAPTATDAADDLQRWPVFDPGNIVEAIGHDQQKLALVTGAFIRQTETLIGEMNEAVDHRDAATLGRVAHRVAGSSLSFGAVRLGETCRTLERLAGQGDWNGIERVRRLLPQSFTAAAAACRQAVAAQESTSL